MYIFYTYQQPDKRWKWKVIDVTGTANIPAGESHSTFAEEKHCLDNAEELQKHLRDYINGTLSPAVRMENHRDMHCSWKCLNRSRVIGASIHTFSHRTFAEHNLRSVARAIQEYLKK